MRTYKPTLKQKKWMLKAGLNWREWQVVRENDAGLTIIHTNTRQEQIITPSGDNRMLEVTPCIS